MRLLDFQKIKDGKYLKNYELHYENKSGTLKKYEIVSHAELTSIDDIGKKISGVSIVAIYEDKLLLLKEFRMGVNRHIYNLCAGMLEENETMEDCIRRELHEETGLYVKEILDILPPAFAAVAITDVLNQIAFVRVDGSLSDAFLSENEEIRAGFYTKNEVANLLKTETFSSRAQVIAYFFIKDRLI